MPRLSFLFRTDVHVYDRSPASWKASYPDEIWSSLRHIGDLARLHDVTAVLDGGDYFHVKAAGKNPHHLLATTADIHQKYPCPVWCLEGNHDMAYNRLDSIPKQPLGVLYATGVFSHLKDQVFRDGDLQVRVVGVPYNPNRSLDDLRSLKKQPGDTYLIAVVHALAAEDPPRHVEDFFGEPVFRYRDLEHLDGPDAYLFGHWHKDQGLTRFGHVWMVNQGSISRGSLNRDAVTRIPKVTLLDFDGLGFTVETLEIPVAPADHVFDLEAKSRVDQEEAELEKFVGQMVQQLETTEGATWETILGQLDFARDVRNTVREYLTRAEETG